VQLNLFTKRYIIAILNQGSDCFLYRFNAKSIAFPAKKRIKHSLNCAG